MRQSRGFCRILCSRLSCRGIGFPAALDTICATTCQCLGFEESCPQQAVNGTKQHQIPHLFVASRSPSKLSALQPSPRWQGRQPAPEHCSARQAHGPVCAPDKGASARNHAACARCFLACERKLIISNTEEDRKISATHNIIALPVLARSSKMSGVCHTCKYIKRDENLDIELC